MSTTETRESMHASAHALPRTPLFQAFPEFDTRTVWVLLWSQQQGFLHIETLDEMLQSHARAFREDRALQYIPLVIGDREVIDAAVAKIRPIVAERYDAKHRDEDGFIPYSELP